MSTPPPPAIERLRSARRIGLVLSGGSARCAFQVGVIETLFELGLRPALCVGVSGGAWNAAAVAAGEQARLRTYWRAFVRMARFDLRNLTRDRSPWLYVEAHRRTFNRYVGAARLGRPGALPAWIGVTHLWDRRPAWFDARRFDDPLALLLASNYVPPFYTTAPRIHGERYLDGGFTDNIPYRKAFEEGCDLVVLVTHKSESEGLPFLNPREPRHEIPAPWRERTVLVRPRQPVPVTFTDRRWPLLVETMTIGRLRAREVFLGEEHPELAVPPLQPPPRYLRRMLRLVPRRVLRGVLGRRGEGEVTL